MAGRWINRPPFRVAQAPVWLALIFAWLSVGASPARPDDSRPARLEAFYSARSGDALRQYGYRLFGGLAPPGEQPVGAVAEDYVVGVGDRFSVTFRGGRNETVERAVDSAGRLVLPQLPPIPAAGRSLGDLRAAVAAEVATRLGATQIYLTVAEVRQIAVLVVGEVPQPGRHRLAAFGTLLDGLAAAGGVARHGSLRAIRLVRAGETRTIDLYGLLQGTADGAEPGLRDGDRLVVPPLGATLAVTGAVRRPGIYELPPGAAEIDAEAALALAGGPQQPGPLSLLRQALGEDGVDRTRPVGSLAGTVLRDGDILRVAPRLAAATGQVRLIGHVTAPGPYALAEAPSLAALVSRDRLGDTPYLPFAVLERRDRRSGARVLEPVDLAAVVEGRVERPLSDGDRVIVLSTREIAFLGSGVVLTLLGGGDLPDDHLARCAGLAALARAMGPEGDPRLRDGRLAETARRLTPVPMACPTLLDRIPGLLPLAVAHSVVLWDGVARPGLYPAASAAALEDLMALGGGGSGGAARVMERPGAAVARPGETVAASPAQVALAGPVSLPGWRDLATAPSLRRLLGDGEVLEADVYPLFGLILRRADEGVGGRVLPFSPAAILAGETNLQLRDGDRVRLLKDEDIRGVLGADEAEAAAEDAVIPALGAAYLAALLADHAVSVTGAVARPGRYPVAGTATLARLLEAAGGITRRGDRSAVDVIQEDSVDAPTAESVPVAARFTVDLTWQDPETLVLGPGDSVRVPARFDPVIPAAVTIEGEVMHPGTYPLVRGEQLSDLIERAGGLTRDAYADGAIFTREVERQRRTAEFRRQADEIERQLATRLLEEDPPAPAQVDRVRDLIAELRGIEPPGRVVVEADPEVLALHPERDPLLAAGDALFIPMRSLSVRVTGEVLSPAALPFRSGMDAEDYIRAAGGFTRFADRDRVFLLHADGSAQPVAESLWRFTPVPVPPGATIVVPRDPEPFDFLAFTESIASVLGQIALTAASISVIGD